MERDVGWARQTFSHMPDGLMQDQYDVFLVAGLLEHLHESLPH